MGNTHNINIPQKSSEPDKFTNYSSDYNQGCPWKLAALMTIGDISVSDVSPENNIDELYITPIKNQYFYTISDKLSARAPPAT